MNALQFRSNPSGLQPSRYPEYSNYYTKYRSYGYSAGNVMANQTLVGAIDAGMPTRVYRVPVMQPLYRNPHDGYLQGNNLREPYGELGMANWSPRTPADFGADTLTQLWQ